MQSTGPHNFAGTRYDQRQTTQVSLVIVAATFLATLPCVAGEDVLNGSHLIFHYSFDEDPYDTSVTFKQQPHNKVYVGTMQVPGVLDEAPSKGEQQGWLAFGARVVEGGVQGNCMSNDQAKGGMLAKYLIHPTTNWQWSFSIWFNAADVDCDVPQIVYECGGMHYGFLAYVWKGRLYIAQGPPWSSEILISTDKLRSGRWHHLAATCNYKDSSEESLKGYLDGNLFGAAKSNAEHRGGFNFGIGTNYGSVEFVDQQGQREGTHEYFKHSFIGKIDEVRQYEDLALNAEQIKQLTALDSQVKGDVSQSKTQVSNDELIMYFAFDEDAGDVAKDGSGHDTSTPAPLLGDAKVVLGQGVKGGALLLPGGDSQLDSDRSGGPVGLTKRTVAMWFKAKDLEAETYQSLYEYGGLFRGLNLYMHEGMLCAYGWNAVVRDWEEAPVLWKGTLLETDAVESGRWHHVAMVLDAQRGKLAEDGFRLYLDGKLNGSGTAAEIHLRNLGFGGGIGNSKGETKFDSKIGRNRASTRTTGFSGLLDEVRVYNRALSEDELKKLASPQAE